MTGSSRGFRPVLALFFASGAVGLVYQVVWVRLFIHVFGATVLAVSTVLAAFMTGLALGGLLGGRFADRLRNPLRAYGLAEVGLAACAAAVPFVLRLLDPAYEALYGSLAGHFTTLSAVRFLVSVVVLLPPTVLMGATLPFLVAHAESMAEHARPRVAHLYAVNTFGAVAGTAAASFLLLPTIGLSRTLAFGIALNLLLACAALLLARAGGSRAAAPANGAASPPPRTAAPSPSRSAAGEAVLPVPAPLVLATAAALGFSALAFEVLWTRTLALALGTTTYAFAIVLTVFLLGIAGGSAWAGRVLRGPTNRALALFLGSPALIGFFALMLLPTFDALPALFVKLSSRGGGTWGEGLAIRFLLAGLPLLPPTFLSGAAFPLAVGAMSGRGAGRSVGDVYAANTFGAILGSWAAGFLLIPAVGLRTGVIIAAALPIAASCVLLVTRRGRSRTIAVAVAVAAIAVVLLLPEWDLGALTRSGFATTIAKRRSGNQVETEDRRELVFLEEGITSTITVRRQGDYLSMQMNGVTEASNVGDIQTQVFVGGFGPLLHPDPQDVLVIGLGSGITAAAALRTPEVQRLNCVEISEAVVNAAHLFDEWNGHIFDEPRARVIVGDGRNHLRLSGLSYDVIVSQPSHVWNAGIGSLMSSEFYRAAADHLKPGGILVSWIQGYSLSPEALRWVLAAVRESFPRVSLWMAGWSDLVIIAGDETLSVDVERLLRRARDPGIADLLREMDTPDVLTLVSQNIFAGGAVDRYVGDSPANTDDNLLLEFEAPKLLYRETLPELMQSFRRDGIQEMLTNAPDGLVAQLDRARRARSLEDGAWVAFREQRGDEGIRMAEEAWTLLPEAPSIAGLLCNALHGRGQVKERHGDVQGAADDYIHASEVAPARAEPFLGLMRLYRDAGKISSAFEAVDEALRREPRNVEALVGRAQLHLRRRETDEAAAWARMAIDVNPDAWVAHRLLGQALAAAGRTGEADAAFAEALRVNPDDEETRVLRAKLGTSSE